MAGVVLRLDEERWRRHQRSVIDSGPVIVPVAKGNGYGFGLARLAGESATLGVETVAVGMASEVAAVRDRFAGDVVILTPYRPGDPLAAALLDDPRVITTVSRVSDLEAIVADHDHPRVLLEVRTSMRRFGIPPDDLDRLAQLLDGVWFEGWTIHLPIRPDRRRAEAQRLGQLAVAVRSAPLWLSHLPADETVALGRELEVPVRLRVGTGLWLGDKGAYATTATVLDVHRVARGKRIGYRQRRAAADGSVVIMAGGTSHGIGLAAPTPAVSLRQRAVAVAQGSLEAAGRALSPYTIGGRKRWFVEPPHMQSSLVFLPRSVAAPPIGAEVPVEVRLTTASFDQVISS